MRHDVLVIDDARDIHLLLEARLRSEGLTLHSAFDETSGFALALELEPDLVLLDVSLDGSSGLDLCKRLKEHPATAQIPIIFLSAAHDTDTKVRGFDLGAVDYVTKPFEPIELRARVRAAIRTKRYQDMLTTMARVDALTGLKNRTFFDQRIADELAAAQRYGRAVSLVMLDVDHFKRINDGYGHPFGDRVLQAVGATLSSALRAADAACRYGGEEFALVLTETELPGALLVAERVRKAIAALTLTHRRDTVPVRVSCGVASVRSSRAATAAALVAAADEALYQAKRSGRDRCVAGVGTIHPSLEPDAEFVASHIVVPPEARAPSLTVVAR